MYSFRFLTTLSVFLGLCILVVEIRPSYSMPIEGDKNSDKYQGIFDLIAQRLRNLSEVNREDDAQNIRKSYLPLTTLGNIMNRTSVSQNTTNVNNTAGLRGATKKHQINKQNSRRSYVPTGISFTRNFLAGNTPAANQMAGRSTGGNQLVGNFPARNLSVGNQLSGNFPARNPAAKNELTGNFPVGIRQAVTFPNVTRPASYSLTNREQTGASMFPASLNDGPTSHEDRSGLYTNFYRQPLTYDRKDTIYRQNVPVSNHYSQGNVNVYGTIASSSVEARRGGFISPYPQYTQSYQNYQQSLGHRIPNYPEYSSYSGYPSNQQQQWRRGYSAGPGYQVSYPGISQQYKDPRERFPMDKKWSVPVTRKESENHINNKHDDTPLPMLSTVQRKLPEKPVKKSKSPRIQSLPADSITSSGSGSGLDDSDVMSDESDKTNITADIQESQEFSGSGSGDNDEDLNGDTSNVAFMLAGTHDDPIKPPSFPVPGLPTKLTRKQALDIYKSALYFAGLLREDNLNNDKAGSGNDVIDDEDRDDTKIDDEDDDDDVNDDNDVTITDNDVKEALAASSGELPASGQPISDAEASGSQSEPPVTQSQSKDNDTIIKGESEGQKTASNFPKLVSEPPKEAVQAPPPDNLAQKIEEEAPKDEEEDADKEQSNTEQGENVEDINAETPPPPDSDKQTTDSTVQDDDTPPPDETRQMKEAQTKYAEDQQEEKALSYLANARQRGVYSSPSQRTVICKDTTQKISCPPQQRIRILNADYGDTGDVGCLKAANPMPAGMCRTPGAYEAVKRRCDGLEDCDLFASNGVFGDACPDANKYLDVNYDCVNNPAHKKFEPPRPPPQQEEKSSPGLQPIIQLPQFIFQVPYPAAPAPGYNQASYQPSSQYVNPPPPPVAYAPAPYQAPPPAAYAPAMALPNLLPPSPYVAPDPCNPCSTCAQCSLPVCSPCTQACHALTCPPRIPAKLQPLWQQWNERTADMSRMEMAALIISPLPKLAAPTKAPETTEASGAAEGSESESGDETTDEDALYEASKRSGIQRVKSQPKSKKTSLTGHKKAHDKEESEQGFLRNSDLMVSSGDASSGSST